MFDTNVLNISTYSFFDIIINIGVAFIFGLFITVIYRLTYTGHSYSSSFVNAMIILSMVTAIVIMVIGNNLARAFGLVGAMSIIRFRTVIKDTRDIVFVFFALAGGMAAGAGNHAIGITGAFITGFVIVLLYVINYGSTKQRELLLQFYMTPRSGEETVYLPLFRKYFKSFTLLNIKSVRLGQFLELSFHIRMKNLDLHQKFISDLSGLEGIERISLVFSPEEEE